MQMQVDLDMNNKKISNVASGTDDNDVVNKKQMENNLKYFIQGFIDRGWRLFYLNNSSVHANIPYKKIIKIHCSYITNFSANYPRIEITLNSGNKTLSFRSSSEGKNQEIVVNRTLNDPLLSIQLSDGPLDNRRPLGHSNDKISILIELAYH